MDQFVWWMLLGSLLVLMVAGLSVIFCCANTLRGNKKKKKKKDGEKRDCESMGGKRWTVFNCNFSPPKLSVSDEVKTGTKQQQEEDVSSIQRLGRESKANLVSRQTCSRCLMMLCNTLYLVLSLL